MSPDGIDRGRWRRVVAALLAATSLAVLAGLAVSFGRDELPAFSDAKLEAAHQTAAVFECLRREVGRLDPVPTEVGRSADDIGGPDFWYQRVVAWAFPEVPIATAGEVPVQRVTVVRGSGPCGGLVLQVEGL